MLLKKTVRCARSAFVGWAGGPVVEGLVSACAGCAGGVSSHAAQPEPVHIVAAAKADGNQVAEPSWFGGAQQRSLHEDALVPVMANDPMWGSLNAPVTVVVFGDLECPFTARFEETLQWVRKDLGPDHLRLVWKHPPLPFHKHAPPWTTATRSAVQFLERLPRWFADTPMAIEFRRPSWLDSSRRDRVFSMLRTSGLAYACVDEPDVPGGGVPPVIASTLSSLALIRFHGHHRSGWSPNASVLERFNSLYSPEELQRWVQPVRTLAQEAEQVHVVFNNCVRDYAVLNAKGLAALMVDGTTAELPEPPLQLDGVSYV